jgi:endonuclease-3 related protein
MEYMREVMSVYKALLNRYGPQDWWPADTPFEVMVGAILTQRTSWGNVEQAIRNLKESGLLEVEALASATPKRIMGLVRPSGFYKVKTARILNLARHIESSCESLEEFFDKPVPDLRKELLALEGIGKETADSIILYAAGRPIFVVDAYTKRLCERLPLPVDARNYDVIQSYFQRSIARDVRLYKELHALIVHHCKDICRTKPICAGCPLLGMCKYPK